MINKYYSIDLTGCARVQEDVCSATVPDNTTCPLVKCTVRCVTVS